MVLVSMPRYFAFGSKTGFLPPSAVLGEILKYALIMPPLVPVRNSVYSGAMDRS